MKAFRFLLARLAVALAAILSLLPAHAAKIANISLAGTDFGHQNGVDVTSAPTTLEAQSRYYYRIEGKIRGTGALSVVIPSGTDIASLLEDIQPGSSAQLVGFYDNVGGGLPFTFIDRTFSGTVSTPAGNVNASLKILGSVNAGGIVRVQITNVTLTLAGFPVSGTVLFESGSKATIGIPPILQFALAEVTVEEDAGTVVLTVKRSANSSGAHQVAYATANGTALAGTHYTGTSGTLNFGNTVTSRTITVNVADNGATNPARTFTVALSSPTLGAELGPRAIVTVTINDDDGGSGQQVGFSNPSATYSEGDGTVQIAVVRTGGTTGEVKVNYRATTAAGGAPGASGADFDLDAGTLTFADGVTTQNIALTVIDDPRPEPTEDLRIVLFGPTGATVGPNAALTVNLTDNDAGAGHNFDSAGFTGLGGGADYGIVRFQTTPTGATTGTIVSDGATYGFKGIFDSDGTFRRNFAPPSTRPRGSVPTLTLELALAGDNTTFSGSFDGRAIAGERNKAGSMAAPVDEAGAYTATLGVTDLSPGGGPLTGFLSLTLSASGAAKFRGALPDGAKLSGTSNVSLTGKLPIALGLYTGKTGFLTGATSLALTDLRRWTGAMTWTKPPGSGGLYGSAGLGAVPALLAGVRFVKPAAGTFVLSDLAAGNGQATVMLAQGNLAGPQAMAIPVTVDLRSKVTVDAPGAERLQLTLKPRKGSLSGSFLDGAIERRFKGVLLQDSAGNQLGAGFFLGTDVAGSVVFDPKD